MRTTRVQSKIKNQKSKIAAPPGFTLVELLVVIGIIVLLVGILLPVANGVRKSAHAAAAGQQIARLTAAIEAYYGDHRAYPGPQSNDFIIFGDRPGDRAPVKLEGQRVTMSENLVLGLIGGLKPSGKADPAGEYDVDRVASRMGAMSINTASPKAGHTYIEVGAAELSLPSDPTKAKQYQSESGGPIAEDSPVPEFVDSFPDSLPILYYRARRGASGVISGPGVTGAYQYDVRQNDAYLRKTATGANNFTSGIGGTGPHGLTTIGPEKLITDPTVKTPEAPWGTGSPKAGEPPYTAFTYFANPQIRSGTTVTNATATPRQKDGYILISPGKDRIYGTRDDITNFGGLQ